jgi:hypothetical protein
MRWVISLPFEQLLTSEKGIWAMILDGIINLPFLRQSFIMYCDI